MWCVCLCMCMLCVCICVCVIFLFFYWSGEEWPHHPRVCGLRDQEAPAWLPEPQPSVRLMVVDCRQLLAFSEEISEDQRTKVLDAIGCECSLWDGEVDKMDNILAAVVFIY